MKIYTMKELPVCERPYEKLLNYGEQNLSNAELLAIVIKTGTKDNTALDLANQILMLDNENSLSSISNLEISQIMQIKGIGKVKAIQIKAVLELAKRIARPNGKDKIKIKSANTVYTLLQHQCINECKEKIFVISLNIKNEVIKISTLAIGGASQISIDMKEIFNEPIKLLANGIILVHNHPSGDTTPSKADISFTYKVIEASKIVGIELIDHLVISNVGYTSLKEKGII